MSSNTENFLRMCIEELGIAKKVLLEDIAYSYEKWQSYPHFSAYTGEGATTAWIGPIEPGEPLPDGRRMPLGPVPFFGFVEDPQGRMFSFRSSERRPFEDSDFHLILNHLKRDIELDEKSLPVYFQKMYRLHLTMEDYALDSNKVPFDWNDVAIWNLRWIIKGLDMESPQKKRIFQHICDALSEEWTALQQTTQSKWDQDRLALLKLDDSATYSDYLRFGQLAEKIEATALKDFARFPWAIGVVNGKSALPERTRFQIDKALQQGTQLETALLTALNVSADTLQKLAGKKLGELAGDPLKALEKL
ncbi:MAG: hypothetical protein KGZ83_14230 [Sulfuricella sp.]|nr:hypothetical protein [Sulfuricella sp.]